MAQVTYFTWLQDTRQQSSAAMQPEPKPAITISLLHHTNSQHLAYKGLPFANSQPSSLTPSPSPRQTRQHSAISIETLEQEAAVPLKRAAPAPAQSYAARLPSDDCSLYGFAHP